VINAGGLISVYCELRGWPADKAMHDAGLIYDTVEKILRKAQGEGISTLLASNRLAEERIEQVAAIKRLHVG